MTTQKLSTKLFLCSTSLLCHFRRSYIGLNCLLPPQKYASNYVCSIQTSCRWWLMWPSDFIRPSMVSSNHSKLIIFCQQTSGMTSQNVSLDIFELFGGTIESFRARQNNVVELIWDSQIDGEEFEDEEAIDVRTLSRWLAPQDRVLESLNRDHSTFVDQQVVSLDSTYILRHL